jgi:hypothetical protein
VKYDKILLILSLTLTFTAFTLWLGCHQISNSPQNRTNTKNIKLIGHIGQSNNTVSQTSYTDPATGLTISGNYAYVTVPKCIIDTDDAREMCNEYWLRVVDISNPTASVEISVHILPVLYINDMEVSGNYAYISTGFWLKVLDISDLTTMNEVGSYRRLLKKGYTSGGTYRINVTGNQAYINASHCKAQGKCVYEQWILDVSDPTDPVEIGVNNITAQQAYSNAQDIAVTDKYLYLAHGQRGLQILDLSDPTRPTEVGLFNTPKGVWSVAVVNEKNNYFCISDWDGSLSFLQLK